MSFNTWFWPVWRLQCILGLDVPPPLPHHFYALFPAPPGWACARREPLDFMMQGKINRGWHTDHPAGCHSIRTNHSPPPPSPIFYKPDALSATQPTVSKHWCNILGRITHTIGLLWSTWTIFLFLSHLLNMFHLQKKKCGMFCGNGRYLGVASEVQKF